MEMEQRERILESLLNSTKAGLFASEFTPEAFLDLKEHSFQYHIYNDFKDPKPHYGVADLEEIIKDLTERERSLILILMKKQV